MNLFEAFIDELEKTAAHWWTGKGKPPPLSRKMPPGSMKDEHAKELMSLHRTDPGKAKEHRDLLQMIWSKGSRDYPPKKFWEKKAVWKAPGQTSLSQSLPGKIPKSRLGRLFGDPSTKVRGDYAKMLREQRGGPGEESARHLLAVARAHAAGRSGVEGFEGQQKIEKAKLLARDAKDAAMRESDNTVVGRFLNALNPFKEKKRKHYGSRVFEPEKGVRFAPRSSESIKGKKSSAAAEMLAAPFMLLHPPIKG